MRVAVVHSFYRASIPSGENTVVESLVAALDQRGHEVKLVARQSPDRAGHAQQLRYAVAVGTGFGVDPTSELADFNPDVVHVHNLFPAFGDRWLARWPGPVIASVHNYRAICAKGVLFRDGRVCRDCAEESPWAGFRHKCYRNARTATLPLTLSQLGGLSANRLFARADVVTVPSDRARREFLAAGWPWAAPLVLPSGVLDLGQPGTFTSRDARWLTAGRLVPEKGLRTLLDWWPPQWPLDVVGDGPLAESLRATAPPGVRVLPSMTRDKYISELAGYAGFVFASVWPETQGMTAVEALAQALPVVARRGSAGADLAGAVDPGWVYGDRSGLERALQKVLVEGEEARRRARAYFEEHLTVDRWIAALEEAYLKAARRFGPR